MGRINKRDLCILAGLLTIGVIGVFFVQAFEKNGAHGRLYAAVHFFGEVSFMVDLNIDNVFSLAEALNREPNGLPQVYFEVQGGAIAFVSSDCPDLLCVHMGPQSQIGGFAACLPNRLFFYIEEVVYSLHSKAFFGIFDTVIFLRLFAPSEEAFELYANAIYEELHRLHVLFDIFNEYEGITNIASINRMAGVKPLTICADLFEFLTKAKAIYHKSSGSVNIAMGPVLRHWHKFITGESNLPPNKAELETAALLSNFDDVIFYENQVFLTKKGMSLDVGALAKGFALERIYLASKDLGIISGIISIGGDMLIIGYPLDGREFWSVGIEDQVGAGLFGIKQISGTSIATSGINQRFKMYMDERFHHIIDPSTLMPKNQFSSLTIIHPSPWIAEFLSTAAFILPLQEGFKLVNEFDACALWIFPDGSYMHTDGFTFIEVD